MPMRMVPYSNITIQPSILNTTSATMTPSLGTYRTDATYELPSTVKALRDGWLSTFRTSAVIAALFALVESQLLPLVKAKTEIGGGGYRTEQALLALIYLTFFFFLSSTMSSLILIDELGSISLRAARCNAAGKGYLDATTYDESSCALLTRFNGGRKSWRWIMWHWMFTLLSGYVCLLVQIELYAWSTEHTPVKIVSVIAGIIAVLPLFDFLPRHLV